MYERDCEADEGCVNTALGACFACGRHLCGLHMMFDAHGCGAPGDAGTAVATIDTLAVLVSAAERTMRGDDYPCEECSAASERLCVGCDRFLCQRHYAGHLCDQAESSHSAS